MIPLGLHVLGEPPAREELIDTIALVAAFTRPKHPTRHDETLPPLPELIGTGVWLGFPGLAPHDQE